MAFDELIRHITKLQDVNPQLREQLARYCYDTIGCCQFVHREMGPFLNEYMYQDAFAVALTKAEIPFQKEYYFKTHFMGVELSHTHKVDFFVKDKIYVECKAIETIGTEQRQQLWNYMRLTKVRIGILYNFAPVKDQCERYYLDPDAQVMYVW